MTRGAGPDVLATDEPVTGLPWDGPTHVMALRAGLEEGGSPSWEKAKDLCPSLSRHHHHHHHHRHTSAFSGSTSKPLPPSRANVSGEIDISIIHHISNSGLKLILALLI